MSAVSQLSDLELTRRTLLRALGGGMLALVIVPEALSNLAAQRRRGEVTQQISAWVHIAPDGKITVFSGKVEVGQNARTSITQAAAEELRVSTDAVTVTMGDTDLVPFDMGTFGSRTSPNMIPQIRRAAAAVRETLLDLAAAKWKLDRSTFKAAGGKVTNSNGAALSYGELAAGHPFDKPIDANVPLTAPSEWQTLGKPVAKVGARDIVTGKHQYGADMRREGMLYAKVLRPKSRGATLKSVDTAAAAAMPGVKVVHDGAFVAVAAPTLRLAEQALASIKSDWKETPQPSSKNLAMLLRGAEVRPPTPATSAPHKLEATYTCAFIAHVPLEPRAALAEWDGTRMTVHTGTQTPFGVRDEVASALGLPAAQVRIIVPDTGSGYGGKHIGDAAVEAARIAKAVGKPVKIVWTRPEEFSFAYFRPGGVVEVTSAANSDGTLVLWEYDNYNSGSPGIGTPYTVPSPRTDFHEAESPLRQGSYRGLAATFNNFARESHMDELAHAVGMDSLEFRLKNLSDQRLKDVLNAACERFGWSTQKPASGHGFGVACGAEKGGHVATVVEVTVDEQTKAIRVVRTVTAFECGAILNPDLLKNQVDGAVIMGLGGALFEAIEFADGKILTDRLSRYRVPRYSDIPVVEAILLDRKDLPSAGAGECPIIAIAPAIANAVFQATGTRLRSMPLKYT